VKRVLFGVLVAVLALATVVVGRALTFQSAQVMVPAAPRVEIDAQAVAARLSAAVKVATISEPSVADPNTFAALQALLRQHYPRVFQKLEVEELGGSLLLTWKGADAQLSPVMLLAHQDVVPVEPGTEAAWQHGPFSGDVAEGFVWGRGAMDDKASLISILEAVELLLAAGHAPRRTILLGFGHDEESGGSGAAGVAAKLEERGVKLLFVLDEGLVITRGIIPGVKPDVAMLGVGERGFLSLELTAQAEGGHSSMPPKQTAIGRLSKAMVQLETAPRPSSLEGPTGLFLDTVGPEMAFGMKLVMANRWLFGPIVLRIYDGKNSTRAAVQTSVAPTMLRAGVKDNVLAREAKATVNFRIRPGDSKAEVVARVKRTIADDGVVVSESKTSISSEPSPVTNLNSAGYRRVERTLRSVFPDTVVAPSLVLGATDGRHFTRLSDSVLRMAPMVVEQSDLDRLHGVNERVSVQGLGEMVRFYRQVMLDADAP
jgi:carboxypeptidase PM20D1